MDRPWENENCEEIQAYYSIYPVTVAAALWCGVPPNLVDKYLSTAVEVSPGVLRHPKVKCLEVKCRVIHGAITSKCLPVSRENGQIVSEHATPARRHVSRIHLKEWISKEFPSKKPEFLFDELERKSHNAINADSYRVLQADRDAAHSEIRMLVSFRGNPVTVSKSKWFGRPWTSASIIELPSDSNNYFSLARFKPDEAGEYRRKKSQFHVLHAVMLDDIGSKIPVEV